MGRFAEDALSIFETAESAIRAGHTPADLTILTGVPGAGIRVIADSDWQMEALRAEHAAHAVYRVTARDGVVLVDGREVGRSCHLEAESPNRAARFLLARATSNAEFRPAVAALPAPSFRE
jgi:hypothetical protein